MTITDRITDKPALVTWLFPQGQPEQAGRRIRCGDSNGAPGTSFIISAATGRWHEYAGGDSGDLVDLLIARGYAVDAAGVADWLESGGWLDAGAVRTAPPPPPVIPAQAGIRRRLTPAPVDADAPTPQQVAAHADYIGLAQCAPPDCYTYRRADGRPVLCVVRYHTPQGKRLSRWSWQGRRGWRPWGTAGAGPIPLYRLPALMAAPDSPVLLVEGEKTADAAAGIFPAYAAVCALGGAKPADGTDWTPLAGRDVIIAPDYDRAGLRFQHRAGRLVTDAGAGRVRCSAPDALYRAMTGRTDAPPRGWDIADLLNQ